MEYYKSRCWLNKVRVSRGWAVDKNQIKPLSVFGAYRLVLRSVGALT